MMVARAGKGQLGMKTKPEKAQAEGRQLAGRFEILVWPKGASRPAAVAEIQSPRPLGREQGSRVPRGHSPGRISAGPHVHFFPTLQREGPRRW